MNSWTNGGIIHYVNHVMSDEVCRVSSKSLFPDRYLRQTEMPSRRNSRNSASLFGPDPWQSRFAIKLPYSSSERDDHRQLLPLQVPVELIDRIVEFFVLQLSLKPNTQQFASIASLTLTSRTIRQLTLRRFFHDLRLMSREEWSAIFQILNSLSTNPAGGCSIGGFAWVK